MQLHFGGVGYLVDALLRKSCDTYIEHAILRRVYNMLKFKGKYA